MVYPILVGCGLCLFMFLAVGTYRLYKYRKAAIPGVDYFVVHFFSDYFPVEDQYAYDGYRWIMWFSAGLGDELPGDVRNAFILFLLLSGILATSRLYLKKHTPLQVYLGFLFGLFFVFGILL